MAGLAAVPEDWRQGAAALGLFAWRLSQGPLELTWLVTRIERMVNAPDNPTRVSIGAAALTWDGFQHGFDRPVDIRLTDIAGHLVKPILA